MLRPKLLQLIILLTGLAVAELKAQDSLQRLHHLSVKEETIMVIGEKARTVEERLEKSTEKYLSKLQRQEQRLKAKLCKKDSKLARQLFDGLEQKYKALLETPRNLTKYSLVYSPHLDSLTTALNFLKGGSLQSSELTKALSQFSSLQGKLDQTERIRSFLSERKRLLHENLGRLGMLKSLKGFQKQAYYYSQQVKEYKEIWESPSRLEKKLLEVLVSTTAFKDFFRQHSQLASLFAFPSSNTSIVSLAGVQTRASVQQALMDRFGSGPQVQQMLQENLQEARGQLNDLKNKIAQNGNGAFGNSSSDIDLPEGFKPNGQKTKSFLRRLEYGVNLQSQKARRYFPITSDLGFSLGYKLSDNSSIGVGASYRIGWGKGWDQIRITSEGVGLRSYVDIKLKGNLYVSGGYEQNYRTAFHSVQQLHDFSAWQQSGLLGLSRKYQVSKKLKGDIKLLWDFLSYQQIPRTQAILFRVGYNLK